MQQNNNPLSKMQMQPEEDALLLGIRAAETDSQREQLRGRLAGGKIDWQLLWGKAGQQQVQPLLARRLTDSDLKSVLPDEVVQLARKLRLQTTIHNLSVRAELQRIATALHAQGIVVTPLKGTHIAERVYESLDARQVGDIDILVPEAQIELARSILQELGYAPNVAVADRLEQHTFHGLPLVRQGTTGTFVVELHWRLSDPRFITIDYTRLWQRILAESCDEEPLRPLPREETLLFLALHLPKHHFGVLRLLADIDRLIRREGSSLDWPLTLALAEQWSVSWLLYFALHHARVLLDTPVPSGVLQRLTPPTWRRLLVEWLAGPRAILRPPSSEHLGYIRARLAYCAMLHPMSRSLSAYFHYLFPLPTPHRSDLLGRATVGARRLAHGLAWTTLAFVSPLGDGKHQH